MNIKRIDDFIYEIGKYNGMNVPARIFASDVIFKNIEEEAIKQLKNCASLPGVYKYVFGMPDIHTGYGCPIGGILPFTEEGVLTVGATGFDINCGIRTSNTGLFLEDLKKQDIKEIIDSLFEIIPAGLGSYGKIKLSRNELYEVLMDGAKAVVDFGFGSERDLEFIEDHGYNEGANPEAVSEKALAREKKQIGTLGSGNHYLELQYVDEIYDKDVANTLGLKKGQIVYTIHCGSRGLGHQIGSDYLIILEKASKKYKIPILDKELVCAPIKSKEGEMYFGAVKCGINYAFANRQVIDSLVKEFFEEKFGITPTLIYDIGHNTIKKERFDGKDVWIHRKGSTRSYGPGWSGLPEKYKKIGQPAIIGGSMGTSTYILVGTNLAEKMTFASTCHGAGRVMSRKKAKKEYLGIEKILEKKGIYVKGHSKIGLAEEAPEAYKNIDEVINVVDSIGISKKVVKLRPIGVIKG